MLFFGKKKKKEEIAGELKNKTNLYQPNVNDINAPLPAATIPVVGQTIPTSSNENQPTPPVAPAVGPEAPSSVEPAPAVQPEVASPVEQAPAVQPEAPSPVEPAPVVGPEVASPVEPAPVVQPEVASPVEPAPVVGPEVASPVEQAPVVGPEVASPVEPASGNIDATEQSMFVDQPKVAPAPQPTNVEPKFCPNCGNKVEGDTCILCGTKI